MWVVERPYNLWRLILEVKFPFTKALLEQTVEIEINDFKTFLLIFSLEMNLVDVIYPDTILLSVWILRIPQEQKLKSIKSLYRCN